MEGYPSLFCKNLRYHQRYQIYPITKESVDNHFDTARNAFLAIWWKPELFCQMEDDFLMQRPRTGKEWAAFLPDIRRNFQSSYTPLPAYQPAAQL